MSSQPFADGRSREGRHAPATELRPEDIPSKPVALRRIGRLFIPYRLRLGALLGLIFVSAGFGVVNPFLIRGVLDDAFPHRDTTLLTLLVAGMIVLSITTSVIGVAQTWISNQVGQRVMHDLRASVYAHLQRMSLAFFTRTRTGEVQSRAPVSPPPWPSPELAIGAVHALMQGKKLSRSSARLDRRWVGSLWEWAISTRRAIMPRIIVTADPGEKLGRLPQQTPVLLEERVDTIHLSDEHAAQQLIERVGWAVADAEDAERVAA